MYPDQLLVTINDYAYYDFSFNFDTRVFLDQMLCFISQETAARGLSGSGSSERFVLLVGHHRRRLMSSRWRRLTI